MVGLSWVICWVLTNIRREHAGFRLAVQDSIAGRKQQPGLWLWLGLELERTKAELTVISCLHQLGSQAERLGLNRKLMQIADNCQLCLCCPGADSRQRSAIGRQNLASMYVSTRQLRSGLMPRATSKRISPSIIDMPAPAPDIGSPILFHEFR